MMSTKLVIHTQFSHLVFQLIALQEEWYSSALSCCTKMDKDQHFSESLLLPIYFIGLVESGDKWQTGFCSCSICQEDWLTQSFPRDPCTSSWSRFCYTETAGFRWQVSVWWLIHFCYHISDYFLLCSLHEDVTFLWLRPGSGVILLMIWATSKTIY